MKVLIAPDKFKGSLTAQQVCEILATELKKLAPDLDIVTQPLADGGEGISDLLTKQSNGHQIDVEVFDPLMRPIASSYGVSDDGKVAFVEMAKASGLQLLKSDERNCTITSSYGTGQLIQHALNRNVNHIILGIGGSATNDAGLGMAEALGFDLLDKKGEKLKGVGASLIHLEKIVIDNKNPGLAKTKFTVLCDVDNPLHGLNGAAYVFAKQKGASDQEIEILDKGLANFEHVVNKLECDLDFSGAGAAGGMGAGAKLFLNAEIRNGIDFAIDFCEIENKIKQADLVISGEGKIDKQTLSGKVLHGVAMLSQKHGKKLTAICGQCELSTEQLSRIGISKAVTLSDAGTSTSESKRNASHLLKEKAAQILSL